MKMHIENGIKVNKVALLCMAANTDMFDVIIDDIMYDEGYEGELMPCLLTAGDLSKVMQELGIPDDKVWYVTEIDGGLLSEVTRCLDGAGFPDIDTEDVIIHYVAIKLLTRQWCSPLH